MVVTAATGMGEVSNRRRYRRSPSLVTYWRGDVQYARGWSSERPHAITMDVLALLGELQHWTSPAELAARCPELGSLASVTELVEAMHLCGWIDVDNAANWDASPWASWHPEAAFFHFGTKNGNYLTDPLGREHEFRARAEHDPPPSPAKSLSGPRVSLPPWQTGSELESILLRRRTWREFAAEPLSTAALSTLLGATWRVQQWGIVEGQGRVALKTSPSAGARHPIEAYVLVLNVEGLVPGVYHYDAATHDLVDLRRRIEPAIVPTLLANQAYFQGAAALVCMCAVFERSSWRYPFSRAYRAVLLDAGHLCQTFCLAATALNLAPFCTMAFWERELEPLLGLDPLREAPLYVAGVGLPPTTRASRRGQVPEVTHAG